MALVVPKLPAGHQPRELLRSEEATLTIKNNSNIPITVGSHPQLSVITVQPNSKTDVAASINQTFQVTSQGQTRNVKVAKKNEVLVIDSNRTFGDRGLSSSNEPIRLYPLSQYRDVKDIKSTHSDIDIFITFNNKTTENVNLDWISFEGQRHRFRSLIPQQSYRQPTFVGHVWEVVINKEKYTQLFLANDKAEYTAYIGYKDKLTLIPIEGNAPPSTLGGPTTSIRFINHSDSVANIFLINLDGQPRLEYTLELGGSFISLTATTYIWKVVAGLKTNFYRPVNSDANVFVKDR